MATLFGFIGCGNMGGALARAVSKSVPGERLLLSDRDETKARAIADETGGSVSDNREVAERADFIFLGVKPQVIAETCAQIALILAGRATAFTLVSMAAGVKIESLTQMLGDAYPIIRIMPNIPCAVGEGAVLYTSQNTGEEAVDEFLCAMRAAGKLYPMSEKLFDAGTAVSGCGPAYADLFIEAMADGGVACGLSRRDALRLAAQTLLGSAKLYLEGDRHPAQLKDAVCSPAGSTIQGVRVLEKAGFRSALIEAVIAACEKTQKLG